MKVHRTYMQKKSRHCLGRNETKGNAVGQRKETDKTKQSEKVKEDGTGMDSLDGIVAAKE